MLSLKLIKYLSIYLQFPIVTVQDDEFFNTGRLNKRRLASISIINETMKGSDARVGEGHIKWLGGSGCGPRAAFCTPLIYWVSSFQKEIALSRLIVVGYRLMFFN